MKQLIDYIKTALEQTDSLPQALQFLPMSFKKDFPVAYIHSSSRMPNIQTAKAFSSILDKDGFTPTSPSLDEFSFMKNNYPDLLQAPSYICLNKDIKTPLRYDTKRKFDYWKKIQDVGHMSSVFDISSKSNETQCEAEFTLREVIRKRKEVHALKELGFIWLVDSNEDIAPLFTHYFKDKYILINKRYYLGYSKALKDINMRYFLCQDEAIQKYTSIKSE